MKRLMYNKEKKENRKMFNVFTVRVSEYAITMSRQKKNIPTREDAKEYLRKRGVPNANSKCKWYIIADEDIDRFNAFVERQYKAKRKEKAEKFRRWNTVDKMYLKGYKCTDVLEYINR